jgi:hypothetical protein
VGEFRITTLNGWNKTRTVYNLFDRVEPEDRVLGQIMAQSYDHAKETGATNIREIVWPAEPEILRHLESYPGLGADESPSAFQQGVSSAVFRTLGFVQLPCRQRLVDYCWEMMRIKIDVGDYLGVASGKLARDNRGVWLRNIALDFAEESFNFDYLGAKPARAEAWEWAAGGGDSIRNSTVARLIRKICAIHSVLLLLTYLASLGCCCAAPAVFLRKKDEHWLRDTMVAALAVASVGTIVGSCVIAGFNRIYSLPHLPVFVLCMAYAWENRSRLSAVRWRRSHQR